MRMLTVAVGVALLAAGCLGDGSSASRPPSGARRPSAVTIATQLPVATRKVSELLPGPPTRSSDDPNLRWRTRSIATIPCTGEARPACAAAADLAGRTWAGYPCPVLGFEPRIRWVIHGVVDGRPVALTLGAWTCSHDPRIQRDLNVIRRVAYRP
jgi:hypothetical protein